MLISFLGIASMACVAIGISSYALTFQSRQDVVMRNHAFILGQSAREVESRLAQLSGMALFMAGDVNLQEMLAKPAEGYETLGFYLFVNNYSFPLLSMMPIDGQIRLYVTNPKLPERHYGSNATLGNPLRRSFEVLQISRVEQADWLKQMKTKYINQGIWQQVDEDAEGGQYSS